MQYATPSQFIERVGEFDAITLTDRDRIGVVDNRVLNIALNDASSQIDGYLAGRYALPLPSVPLNLVRICCDIARYRLANMSQTGITAEIIERYKLVVKELEQLATGKISLGVEQLASSQDEPDNAVMFRNGNNRVFARDQSN